MTMNCGGRFAVPAQSTASSRTRWPRARRRARLLKSVVKSLVGRTSIAYTSSDPIALAKALTKYAKDNPELKFKAGVVEGRAIEAKDIQALASMPSKEELYSKLLFLMSAPATRLATVINTVGRNLAVVLNQGVERRSFRTASRLLSSVFAARRSGESRRCPGFQDRSLPASVRAAADVLKGSGGGRRPRSFCYPFGPAR